MEKKQSNSPHFDELYQVASAALNHAYARYSNFPVAAAVRLKNGSIFRGFNIENAAYGSTMCAERTAIFAAITQGGARKGDFDEMVVTGKTDGSIAPCGACRQVMSEFFDNDVDIYLTNQKDKVTKTNMDGLLPGAFKDFE